MSILDCQNLDSALTSISESFSINTNEITSRLAGIRIDEGYEVREHLLRQLGQIPNTPSAVYWFHATRVPQDTCFTRGILPLAESLSGILSTLQDISKNYVSDKEWGEFTDFLRSNGSISENTLESNALNLFRMKTHNSHMGGPYGFLVREIIDIPSKVGNHDYLGIPEIVEDVAICFDRRFGTNILQDYKNATVSKIVKFRSIARGDELKSAILYTYSRIHNLELSYQCNTCFDGHGNTISPNDVLGIETPDRPLN